MGNCSFGNCCCCNCCCPCVCCPKPAPICPAPTLPNEPPECETRRQQYEAENPHLNFAINLEAYFFNRQATLAEARNICTNLGYRFATLQELAGIDFRTSRGQFLCPMLVWATATINGLPILAFVVPVAPGTNVVTPVPTPSEMCRGYVVCVTNIE